MAGQPTSQTVQIKGRIVSEVLRVLSPFTQSLLTLCVRYLAYSGPHPYLTLVSSWMCSLLHNGAHLDATKVRVTIETGEVMSFLDRVLGHFQRHRDPLYIQALSNILANIRQTDTNTISEVVGKLNYKEDDNFATKAVCILLPIYLSQDVQPPKLTAELVD